MVLLILVFCRRSGGVWVGIRRSFSGIWYFGWIFLARDGFLCFLFCELVLFLPAQGVGTNFGDLGFVILLFWVFCGLNCGVWVDISRVLGVDDFGNFPCLRVGFT